MDPEIEAMSKVAEALSSLDDDSRTRVLRWAGERYGVIVATAKPSQTSIPTIEDDPDATSASPGGEPAHPEYETLAELFSDAGPTSDADKILVAGYWHQVVEGSSDLTSQQLNTDLKDLGHYVSHVNQKFDSLMAHKPQLAIQMKKSGTSKQARKKYKITRAGIQRVEEMLKNR